jgi:alpha-glucosidase (family GH31 glycosyl hydrolase)
MNSIGSYFVNNMKNAITNKENIIQGKKYRISILTDRLVRLEYSPNGKFEDRPTNRVLYRNFEKVKYSVTKSETLMQIITSYFTINYDMEKSFIGSKITPGSTLKITLNNTDRSWYYNHPEVRNLGTITYSLDDFKGKLKLDKGLYSTDGFAYIDDSESLILNDNGTFSSRIDPEMDLYVFLYRKDLGLALQDYYKLTGYPLLLPRYALGNWWYKDKQYTTNEISKDITKFKEEQIPISIFMLGNKWHNDSEPITIDQNIINSINLKNILTKNNVKLGITINPNEKIPTNSSMYQTLSPMLGNTNPLSFLPIDNNKLNAYSSYVITNLINNGVSVFNIDYNNIKDKVTLAILNHYHYAVNSIQNNSRSVILTRNHNMAIHRQSIIFTGKTKVDWNTLSILPRFNSSASNMGISYIANAIGGYYKGIEDFELYIRYIQLGVFSPILMLASDGSKYYRREPWRFSTSQQEIIRKYLCLRNKLIPYLYTESYIYYKSGSPIIQPLYYKYPKIYDEPMYSNEYFFGSQMLICPITKKKNIMMNRVVQRMFIPEGVWYELESGKKYLGNKYYMSFYKDDDYPAFCKEGSIIVMSRDMDTNNPTNLEVNVFPGSNGSYKLYEDDGISNNYKNTTGAITDYVFNYAKDKYQLSITPSGSLGLVPDIRNYRIRFRNTNSASITVSNGVNNLNATAMLESNDLIIDINKVTSGTNIVVTVTGDNLENSTVKLINDDIGEILEDLEIETLIKEDIDKILFGDLPIRKKRIQIRKLKRKGLEPKFIKMFLKLLEYIETV